MFRPMRRHKQQLTQEECLKVLTEEPRGVMAVHGEDGYPYAFPMDFVLENGKLYFHCAKAGHKLDALAEDSRVSFCVMDEGFRKPGEWPLNIRSVIIFGRVSVVDDPAEVERIARLLGLKYYPSAEEVDEEIRKSIKNMLLLELTPDHMTGKLVNES